jgi:hypothetical protein
VEAVVVVEKELIKSLVQQVVEAYLNEHRSEERKTSIAILFAYQSPNQPEILEAISSLIDSYDVTLLLTRDWLPILTMLNNPSYVLLENTSLKELKIIVEQTSLLVIPVASYQLLSKLALTMDDELIVWLAIQFQLVGKPIVVANNYIEPNVYQQINAPVSVLERVQTYIRQIQSDQVKWVPLSKLSITVDEQFKVYFEKQSLILAKHIEKAFRDGLHEIILPMKSRVTPAAKDLAKELNIQIVKKNILEGG